MNSHPKLYDVVALVSDQPELGLCRGQVGTVMEEYEPGVFEVEFSDQNGRAYRDMFQLEAIPENYKGVNIHVIRPDKLFSI